MFTHDQSTHEHEHQRLYDFGRKVTSLPDATRNPNGRVSYGNLHYYSNGTIWLSTQLQTLVIATRTITDITAGTTSFAAVLPKEHTLGGVYLTGLDVGFTARTAQSGANFYTLSGTYMYPSNSPANVALSLSGTLDTKTFTTINVNNELNYTLAQAVPAGAFRIGLTMTLSGAPGNFLFEATLSYRLVGA